MTMNKQIKNFMYSPENQIGKGFSSTVFRGKNIHTQQPAAIKVIDLKSIKTEIENMLLKNQIKALNLMEHENIIRTYDVLQTANNIYIVTELCDQGDLRQMLKNKGALSEDNALQLFKQILKGTQFIHSKGIIHRDLKSSNILIRSGILKIADFGFCQILSQRVGNQGYNVGSPLYMSPQAYKKSQYSTKSDMWALGVILYQMLIGKQPFQGIDYNTLMKNIATAELYRDLKVSSFVKMILSRLLSLDVERRCSADEAILLMGSSQPKIVSEVMIRPTSQNQLERKTMSKCPDSGGKNFSAFQTVDNGMATPSTKRRTTHGPIRFPDSAEKPKTRDPRLQLVKFVAECCENFKNYGPLLRIQLLSLKHCRHIASFFQNQEVKTILHRNTELSLNFPKQKLSSDIYFLHIIDNSMCQSQTFLDCLLFWLKVSIKSMEESLRQMDDERTKKVIYGCTVYACIYYLQVTEIIKKKQLVFRETVFSSLLKTEDTSKLKVLIDSMFI